MKFILQFSSDDDEGANFPYSTPCDWGWELMPTPQPVAIDLPFRIGPDGAVQTTRDVDRQVRQRLISIIGTIPGERVMLPEFGVPVADYLFHPDPLYVEQELSRLVAQQADMWEPGLNVETVIPVYEDDGNVSRIDVFYQRTDTEDSDPLRARHVHTATVNSSGVREVLRG